MKRRKSRADRKEEQIRVRVTAEQKAAIEGAARSIGLEPAAWVRTVAVQAAEVMRRGR